MIAVPWELMTIRAVYEIRSRLSTPSSGAAHGPTVEPEDLGSPGGQKLVELSTSIGCSFQLMVHLEDAVIHGLMGSGCDILCPN